MKNVFLTGSGSGLGKEAAIWLARRGHTVFASVQYEVQIKPLQKIANDEGLNLYAFKLDVLNEIERNLILNYDIDVFLSNAAIGDSGPVASIPIEKIENVFNTNIFANLHIIQLALKKMILKGNGRIVIISSLMGRIPFPFLSPYCASKFALEAFAICLKDELKLLNKLSGINISVSLIEPGAYATGFNKENNEKKYEWMKSSSYFAPYTDLIHKYETKIWNFLEQKPFNPIIKKYLHSVEDTHTHFRYSAPWWQSFFIQLGRILGM